jgi:hypothetical protein
MSVLSGQTTVATAGAAVPLSSTHINCNGPLGVKALTGNAGFMYVGNVNGDVTSANAIELDAGEDWVFNFVENVEDIIVDTSSNNDKIAWAILNAVIK